ncbi:hypothetical protein B0F90DRAFT_1824119 [Multifurca ochricompacta]|uniref:Uncharacterized protein n=1 Tax=Multifurca ochricompacta TaxID=376703 RepID=A0AAD4QHL6_9AGAM|nr:hypothetical protein B0F90DRAFT_1824119 [Multifurca ochricompacta]
MSEASATTSTSHGPLLAVPSQMDSKMVEDTYIPEYHKMLDICDLHALHHSSDTDTDEILSGRIPHWKILKVVVNGFDKLDRRYCRESLGYVDKINRLFEARPWLPPLLDECLEQKSFRTIRLLEILQKERAADSNQNTDTGDALSDDYGRIVLQSWNREYEGTGMELLCAIITAYNSDTGPIYVRHASILNSPGTGKSRMVDELAKKIVTVPICLRDPQIKGFPPTDDRLRDWLYKTLTYGRDEALTKFYNFLYSLCTVLLVRLQAIEKEQFGTDPPSSANPTPQTTIPKKKKKKKKKTPQTSASELPPEERQVGLAAAFRKLMTEGQTFEKANAYRQKFFDDVIQTKSVFPTITTDMDSVRARVRDAAEAVVLFVNSTALENKYGYKEQPFIIFAFDDSRELTHLERDRGWSIFLQLRAALREVSNFGIFTLFLSAVDSVRFSWEHPLDRHPSNRLVQYAPERLPPITDAAPFDLFEFEAEEGIVTLSTVTEDRWICHLGRPLFAAHYDAAKDLNIHWDPISFAKRKLLDSRDRLKEGDMPGSSQAIYDCIFACLSTRFFVQFKGVRMSMYPFLRRQIEEHTLICLEANLELDEIESFVGSEPLLAEAAAEAISETKISPARHLANFPDVHIIDHGYHGELVGLLLVMQARDTAAKGGNRTISVEQFLKALLPQSIHGQLETARPAYFRENEDKPLFETFKDSRMWFNHVIRIRNPDNVNVRLLWQFITRGAIIVRDYDIYRGIDIVLPVCYSGDVLSRDTVTAILIQVTNDSIFQDSVRRDRFDFMGLYHVGLISKEDSPLPVIRMFLALSSTDSAIHVVPQDKPNPYFPQDFEDNDEVPLTAYDIWCAGLSPETFPGIGEDISAYEDLLARSRPDYGFWGDPNDPGLGDED